MSRPGHPARQQRRRGVRGTHQGGSPAFGHRPTQRYHCDREREDRCADALCRGREGTNARGAHHTRNAVLLQSSWPHQTGSTPRRRTSISRSTCRSIRNGRSVQYGGGGFNGVLITGVGLPPAHPFDKPFALGAGFRHLWNRFRPPGKAGRGAADVRRQRRGFRELRASGLQEGARCRRSDHAARLWQGPGSSTLWAPRKAGAKASPWRNGIRPTLTAFFARAGLLTGRGCSTRVGAAVSATMRRRLPVCRPRQACP